MTRWLKFGVEAVAIAFFWWAFGWKAAVALFLVQWLANIKHCQVVGTKLKVAEKALAALLPYAEHGVNEMNSRMVGDLYPRINEAVLARARAALEDIRMELELNK